MNRLRHLILFVIHVLTKRREIIPDSGFLYKRVPPIQYNFDEDRVSTEAFKTSRHNQSVNWDRYSSPEHTLAGHPPSTGLIKINVKFVRDEQLQVDHEPRWFNYAHSGINGSKLSNRSVAKRLVNNSHPPLKKPVQD